MASKPTAEGQAISDVAHAEGGTTKGSASAQLQSELTKQKNAQTNGTSQSASGQSQATRESNFQEAANDIGSKMQSNPEAITQEDASHLESREHRAMGTRPPSDTISAEAKRMATANEKGERVTAPIGGPTNTKSNATGNVTSSTSQAQGNRDANFEDAINKVAPKMANAPETVTKEDGDLLHSREQRAQGVTQKGGIASEAQKLAAENEGATK